MVSLDCASLRTCPSCWRFQAGRCSLADMVRDAFELPAPPPVAQPGGLALA